MERKEQTPCADRGIIETICRALQLGWKYTENVGKFGTKLGK